MTRTQKKGLGFFVFLLGWASFILNLPDLFEKIGKFVPIARHWGSSLANGVNYLVTRLPPAPDCGTCVAFYLAWPTLLAMLLILLATICFAVVYFRLDPDITGRRLWLVLLLSGGALFNLYVIQSWLLWKYSGIPLIDSLSIITFEGRVHLARDRNFFLQASNIYGVIVLASYYLIILVLRWAWNVYQAEADTG